MSTPILSYTEIKFPNSTIFLYTIIKESRQMWAKCGIDTKRKTPNYLIFSN